MNNKHKRTTSFVVILFFTWLSCTLCYPQRGSAESLAISGLHCKSGEFKPLLENGKFVYFLNQPAAVTVEILDIDFNLIRKIEHMKMEEAGQNVILWDAKDEKGDFIKSGEYTLMVKAMGSVDGAVAASMGIKIALNAPKGTEVKEYVSQIRGREKKEYPAEVPTRLHSTNKAMTYIGGPIIILLKVALSPLALLASLAGTDKEQTSARSFLASTFSLSRTKEHLDLIDVPNYEKYNKIKKEIDEYNTKIDNEIANKNSEIDAYNAKIKGSVVMQISIID